VSCIRRTKPQSRKFRPLIAIESDRRANPAHIQAMPFLQHVKILETTSLKSRPKYLDKIRMGGPGANSASGVAEKRVQTEALCGTGNLYFSYYQGTEDARQV